MFEAEQMQELLRSIYEAANGRQVATTIGLISIAPAVAPYIAKEPFYVETQADFLSQVLGRVAKEISNNRTPARPSRRLGARAVNFQPNARHSRHAEVGPSRISPRFRIGTPKREYEFCTTRSDCCHLNRNRAMGATSVRELACSYQRVTLQKGCHGRPIYAIARLGRSAAN